VLKEVIMGAATKALRKRNKTHRNRRIKEREIKTCKNNIDILTRIKVK
jgi:hypothetical protein